MTRQDVKPTVGHVMRAWLARTETFVRNQIAELTRYRPVVAAHQRRELTEAPLGEGMIAEEELSPSLAALERASYRGAKLALPPASAALAAYLSRQDARLLHHHYLTDARFLLGVQRRLGLPSVVSGYGYDVSSFPRRWHGAGRLYLRPLFERMDLFLAMSDDMATDMLAIGCPESKVRVHYYGSDTRRFAYPERRYEPDAPATVLCCARLHAAKGIRETLQALHRADGDFRVVIVGDGPQRPELEDLVAGWGWTDRVEFTGHLPHDGEELPARFREADVFAHPSLTLNGLKEGIPGTIVEAMAAGLPVVATRHAGIPAVIEDGKSGVLVPEYDPVALTEALAALLADARLRERIGREAARRAGEELDLRSRTVELERIYDELLA